MGSVASSRSPWAYLAGSSSLPKRSWVILGDVRAVLVIS